MTPQTPLEISAYLILGVDVALLRSVGEVLIELLDKCLPIRFAGLA